MKSPTLTDIYFKVKKDDPKRRKNDFYPTPPLATYLLHKYCPPPQTVIEPCAGRGNISVELERNGYTVRSSDLYEYDNPLTEITTGVDALNLPKFWQEDPIGVVTNPPYHKNLPHKLAEKYIEEYDYVAMFLRLTFLEGKRRKKLFTRYKPCDIIFLSDRVRFAEGHIEPVEEKDQTGGMMAYMWIVWRKNSEHTNLHWASLKENYPEWREQYEKNAK